MGLRGPPQVLPLLSPPPSCQARPDCRWAWTVTGAVLLQRMDSGARGGLTGWLSTQFAQQLALETKVTLSCLRGLPPSSSRISQ